MHDLSTNATKLLLSAEPTHDMLEYRLSTKDKAAIDELYQQDLCDEPWESKDGWNASLFDEGVELMNYAEQMRYDNMRMGAKDPTPYLTI